MKFFPRICALFLICFFAASSVFSQENSSRKNDKQSEPKIVKVRTNLMILDSSNQFVNEVRTEDIKVFEDGIEQKITHFDKKPSVLNLGMVFDNSGSMKYILDEIAAVGKAITTNLTQNDECFVVRFVDSDTIEVIQDWTSDKNEIKSTLENMFIQGGQSAVVDAIYLSAEKILERAAKDKTKIYALVIFSDGEERASYYEYKELFSLLNGANIEIYVLLYSPFEMPKKPKNILKFTNELAFKANGIVFNLNRKRTKDDVVATLKALMTELRSNYIVGYTSTNQKRDGLPRKLTVQIADSAKGEKRQGFIRESFVIPKK